MLNNILQLKEQVNAVKDAEKALAAARINGASPQRIKELALVLVTMRAMLNVEAIAELISEKAA